MDRRKTLKTLLTGTVGTALIATQAGCDNADTKVPASATEAKTKGYGLRTGYEAQHDKLVNDLQFFSEHEMAVLAVLVDIICPRDGDRPSATEVGVPEFIEFMAKDQPEQHQTKLRGGLAWLGAESSQRYDGKSFDELTAEQRIAIVDDIAYPDEAADDMLPGVAFFNHMRFLTMTGFYTTKPGWETMDYQGNQANIWDGVPQDVLDKHGLAYDERWMPYYVDQERRSIMAEWDTDKNLIS